MFQYIDAKSRLIISTLGSILIFCLIPQQLLRLARIIIAWNVGAISFLVLTWLMIRYTPSAKMYFQAKRQDESRWIILVVVVAESLVSLVAIAFMLKGNKDVSNDALLTLHIILSLLTIFISWLLVHTMFALHYAHLYYKNYYDLDKAVPLRFLGTSPPDYIDFLYFSIGIGMTSQVADVQVVSSSLRGLVLIHQILAFIFNIVILALSINIMATSITST